MIYSDSQRFVFLHNPKAAGTSVRRALESFDDSGGKYWGLAHVEDGVRLIDRAHICASELHVHELMDRVENYFTFGFARNPYDRFLSAWDEHRGQHGLDPDLDINDWAKQNLSAANIRYDWRYTHFCPQHYFFYRGRKCVADYIGRHERIAEDWAIIQKILGLELPLEIHNRRSEGRHDALDGLERRTIELIHEFYERDFTLFGYVQRSLSEVFLMSSQMNTDPQESDPLGEFSSGEAVNAPQAMASSDAEIIEMDASLSETRDDLRELGNRVEAISTRLVECELEMHSRERLEEEMYVIRYAVDRIDPMSTELNALTDELAELRDRAAQDAVEFAQQSERQREFRTQMDANEANVKAIVQRIQEQMRLTQVVEENASLLGDRLTTTEANTIAALKQEIGEREAAYEVLTMRFTELVETSERRFRDLEIREREALARLAGIENEMHADAQRTFIQRLRRLF